MNFLSRLSIGIVCLLVWGGPAWADTSLSAQKNSLAVGGEFTCLLQDGAIQCIGNNTFGQLGNGQVSKTPVFKAVSVALDSKKKAVALSSGETSACAILEDQSAWAQNNYQTGACFWMEVRKTYGDEMFRKIFQYAHTLKRGKYKMFQDIIHPIVKDDFFSKVKNKYLFTEDPTLTQGRQYFFDLSQGYQDYFN